MEEPEETVTRSLEELAIRFGQYRDQWIALCVILIFLDVMLLGFLCMFNRSKEDWLEYLFSRTGVLFLLYIISLVGSLTRTEPLLYIACGFYSGSSLAHMLRSLRRAGVTDIPPAVEKKVDELYHEDGKATDIHPDTPGH